MTSTPVDLTKYRPLLDKASRMYREDPAYAIAMSKQAGTLSSRRQVQVEKKLAQELDKSPS